jgi:hypothetical protein
MQDLAAELASMDHAVPGAQERAREIITMLGKMNLRWNDPEMKKFLLRRQKEFRLGLYAGS